MNGLAATVDKIAKWRKQGILGQKLRLALNRRLAYVSSLRYVFYNPARDLITLHCPAYVDPSSDQNERNLVERIFAAYRRMKRDEQSISDLYRPSSFWREQLKLSYHNLFEGFEKNNVSVFHFFLANFGTWEQYTGIEHSSLIQTHMKSLAGRLFLMNKVFLHQFRLWNWFHNSQRPLSSLSYPQYGNQAGAFIKGHFVGVSSFFNDIHGAILEQLLVDRSRPVVAELGAGYGKLAYLILRNFPEFCFIDFDLPETLSVASYYLMKTFPHKRVLLYGEAQYDFWSHDKYDLVFMPPWEIEKIGQSTVDLFLNKNSLGEMNSKAVENYVSCISQAARFFFHMNHDKNRHIYEDGEVGLLGSEYPVPRDKFFLLFKYPDLAQLLSEGFVHLESDIFIYLYARKTNLSDTHMASDIAIRLEKELRR